MVEIIFTLQHDSTFITEPYFPVSANKSIPAWYKEMVTGTENAKDDKEIADNQTIKRCMPVFDAITSGYIIKTFTDLVVQRDENGIASYYWGWDSGEHIQIHGPHQLVNYKNLFLQSGAPKLRNPWGIKTPKGYSCLFIPPMHQPACGIRILEGVVDTDKYTVPVQFPFLVDEGFIGTVPAGTPIAQIIPFKRESYKMKIGGNEERQDINRVSSLVRSTFVNGYRGKFRTKKEYL
jgi:hypothetical protein